MRGLARCTRRDLDEAQERPVQNFNTIIRSIIIIYQNHHYHHIYIRIIITTGNYLAYRAREIDNTWQG